MKAVLLSAGAAALCAAFTAFPEETAAAVRKSAVNCLNVLIPSLFAMLVLSRMLISSGIYRVIGRPFGLISRYVFRIPEKLFPIFLISITAGYPVGAALLSEACENGDISEADAAGMICWCFGAGSAFIFGTVGSGVFGDPRCGTAIFISCAAANILLGIISGIGRPVPPKSETFPAPRLDLEMISASVTDGGAAMLKMCAAVMFMSALLSIPETLGITVSAASKLGRLSGNDPYDLYILIKSFFEVTNLTYLKSGSRELLPAAAAAVSFGGISVFMQTAAAGSVRPLFLKFVFMRCVSAVTAAAVCDMLFGVIYSETAVSAMYIPQYTVRHNSPISSVFLLIMTILLLSQKNIVKSRKV